MYAKNIEYLLARLMDSSDAQVDLAQFAERSEALRNSGKWPRGREHRDAVLGAREIAAAILGLVPVNPKWAGHSATVLGSLKPVGGTQSSLHNAPNLQEAVANIISDSDLQAKVVSLTASMAEHGVNSHGFATICLNLGEELIGIHFVSQTAHSLLQPGSELRSRWALSQSPASRDFVIGRRFFSEIASSVERFSEFPGSPVGDGSEYDGPEKQAAHHVKLGVKTHSNYLNMAVDAQVTWPNKDMLVKFDGHDIVLMPITKENSRSIHIDMHHNRLDSLGAMTLINRFLTMLAWCDDQPAILKDGWSGNPIPVPIRKHELGATVTSHWYLNRSTPPSDHARRAMAHYREGLNARHSNLVGYAVLSFFKVLEIKGWDSNKIKRWISSYFISTTGPKIDERALAFLKRCDGEDPAQYIYSACRLAVAHASIKTPSDIDDAGEVRRLYEASDMLRRLARKMITHELGISDNPLKD